MMLVAITFNEDGHFEAADVKDRESTWLLLKSISWGEFYEDQVADKDLQEYDMEDIYDLSDEDWVKYLWDFIVKGQFEIIEI